MYSNKIWKRIIKNQNVFFPDKTFRNMVLSWDFLFLAVSVISGPWLQHTNILALYISSSIVGLPLGKYNREVEANKKFRRKSRIVRYFNVDTNNTCHDPGRAWSFDRKKGETGKKFDNFANGLREARNNVSRIESFARLAGSDLVLRDFHIY